MEAKDYLKGKKIWLGTKVADMNVPENYFELEHLLDDYHQAKLKLLDIPAVMLSFLNFIQEQKLIMVNHGEKINLFQLERLVDKFKNGA